MERLFSVINKNGEKFEADLVLCFEVPEINEQYIIYKFPNESAVNVGNLYKKDDVYYIKNLDNNAEWTFIKKVMAQIVKEEL